MKLSTRILAPLFLSASLAGCVDAPPAPATPNVKNPYSNFTKLIDALPKDVKYVGLGETTHTSEEIKSLEANRFVLGAFKRNRFSLAFQEGAQQDNPLDILINPDDYHCHDSLLGEKTYEATAAANPGIPKGTIRAIIDFKNNTCSANILINHPDMRYMDIENDKELSDFLTLMTNTLTHDTAYDMVLTGALLNKSPELRPGAKKLNTLIRYSLSQELNGMIASNIKHRANDGNAFIIYGYAHFLQAADPGKHFKGDLDEMVSGPDGILGDEAKPDHIGEGKIITIALIPKPDFTIPDITTYLNTRTKLQLPDYFYVISTDEMVRVVPSTESENRFRSFLKNYLTHREYNDAVARLPEDLRPYALPYTEYDDDLDNNQYDELSVKLQ